MRFIRRAFGIALGVAAAHLILLVPGARAQDPSWQEPLELTSGDSLYQDHQLVTDVGGAFIHTWRQESGIGNRVANASFVPAAGVTVVPQALGGRPVGGYGVGSDGRGSAIAAWGEGDQLKVALKPIGGPFAAPSVVPHGGGSIRGTTTAMNAQGDAVVVFAADAPGATEVRAIFRPAGGAFGAPVRVSETPPAGVGVEGIHADLSRNGDVAVTWVAGDAIEAAVGNAAGFAPSQTLDDPPGYSGPQVSIDGAGGALVAWRGGSNNVRVSVRLPGTNSFGAPQEVGPSFGLLAGIRVGAAEDGHAVIAYFGSDLAPTVAPVNTRTGAVGAAFAYDRRAVGLELDVAPDGKVAIAVQSVGGVGSLNADIWVATGTVAGGLRDFRAVYCADVPYRTVKAVAVGSGGNAAVLINDAGEDIRFGDDDRMLIARTAGTPFTPSACDPGPVTPTPPNPPVLYTPPTFTFELPKKQRVPASGRVPVRIRSGLPGLLTLSGEAAVGGRRDRLGPVTSTVAPNETVRLELKLRRKQVRALGDHGVKGRLRVTAWLDVGYSTLKTSGELRIHR